MKKIRKHKSHRGAGDPHAHPSHAANNKMHGTPGVLAGTDTSYDRGTSPEACKGMHENCTTEGAADGDYDD